jgi:hypothetical protein
VGRQQQDPQVQDSLQEDDRNLDDWDIIKREFLKTNEPKYSAQTTCANVADLTQKHNKTINDYHVHVQMAYKRLTDNKPATLPAIRLAGAIVAQAKLKGMNDMAKFFKHLLFLADIVCIKCKKFWDFVIFSGSMFKILPNSLCL